MVEESKNGEDDYTPTLQESLASKLDRLKGIFIEK
jgi:hypothetical protein